MHARGQRLRIDSSIVGMESARRYTSSTIFSRFYKIKDYNGNLGQSSPNLNTAVSGEEEEKETGTANGSEKNQNIFDIQSGFRVNTGRISIRETLGDVFQNIRQQTMRYILDLFFPSRNNTLNVLEDFNLGSVQTVESHEAQYIYEKETTNFSTVGTVKTADGRTINFNLEIGMTREFEQYYETAVVEQQIPLCDPLVINLDSNIAELSDQKFIFDIDGDGIKDEIARLGMGSGYLAIDKNGDGMINDGNELFGTQNGDGFADLAQYDEDGNGWIDENDSIWKHLKIWSQDENGNDVLYTLADKGVGAMNLGNSSTNFSIKDQQTNETLGVIRSTGMFLYENGAVGSMQHVDLAKFNSNA